MLLHVRFMLFGLILACTATSLHASSERYRSLYNDPLGQAAFIESKIREYFPEPGLADAMIELANCESTGLIHWMPDGSLRPHDTRQSSSKGVFQILAKLHGPDMNAMGLDIHNIDDYMVFARHLFDTQGPENAWKECVVQMPAVLVAVLHQ